jgi:hypothetical protein
VTLAQYIMTAKPNFISCSFIQLYVSRDFDSSGLNHGFHNFTQHKLLLRLDVYFSVHIDFRDLLCLR